MDDPVAEIPDIIRTLCTAPSDIQRDTIESYFTSTASFTHPFCRTGSSPWSRWLITQIYRWYKILSPEIDVSVDSVAFDPEKLLLYVSIHQNFKLWVVPFYNAPVKLVTVLQLVKGSTEPGPEPSVVYDPVLSKGNNLDSITNSAMLPDYERADTTLNKTRKKVVIISPLNAQKKATAIPTHNRFSVLTSPPSPSPTLASSISGGDTSGEQYYIQSQNDLYQTSEWIKFLVPWGIGDLLMVLWQFLATFMCVLGALAYDLIDTPRRAYGGILDLGKETTPDTD
ncbi:hypothetical protein LTR84_002420 [Exophiala bonariae]|uniref:SigF-like NTF2-like domain-containing protein n=1 Tax=Exophiala bonariae TaxID=1690606 RepID=A0AAV9N9M3_9EURO|nr:hypothetical protein LTR84_002420 [Exophiala bonariae]